ncbi:hypothetical protein RSOLAG1IB_06777 [Rhizoctonia solani AG-1 IB]|uniref:Uncharacterized protein n=1 Tax=Thanatephorus cucumeris (strain AG1-IB / isolate 7/3/14) TaxID=1108050 RepID=A0A0B7FD45_THACB|nr:hypothetical protein RSOLAG1IB_06777 [Rhizoctonia solani AG-1 IB]
MITPQLDLSNDMNYQHVLRDPAPTVPQSEDAQSILYTPFISAILSTTVLLIHYYIHDLDLRRSLSSGTVRKKPLANTAPSGARRPINIWKAFRLGVCLMLLLLAIVMLGMADSCHNLDSKPDGQVGKDRACVGRTRAQQTQKTSTTYQPVFNQGTVHSTGFGVFLHVYHPTRFLVRLPRFGIQRNL